MVTGVSNLPGFDYPSFSRVKVISSLEESTPDTSDRKPIVLEDNQIPGREKLLEKLQGSVSIEGKFFLAAAESVKKAMSNLLIKKHYPTENRDFRKRTRNDRKTKR